MNKLKKIEEKVSRRQRTLYALFITALVIFGYWNSWQYIPWSSRFALIMLSAVFIVFAMQADMYSEQLVKSKEHLRFQANDIGLKEKKIRDQKRYINEQNKYIDEQVPTIAEVEKLRVKQKGL